jgi:hypothetical protein
MATKGLRMMEEELRQMLKEHGWNLLKRMRRQREYLYAQKWKKGEVYITSQTQLPKITRQDVLKKIEAVS